MDNKENNKKSSEKEKNDNPQEIGSLTVDLLKFMKKIIKAQWIIIFLISFFAIVGIVAQGIYHDYKWSQFETVVVDSNDGGNASYIGNDGDINNYGESSGPQEEELGQ